MPSISAPSETRKRQRSCTCGSQAAFEIIVLAGRERRGHDRVLGRHHRRLVEVDVRAGQAAAQLVAPVDARSSRRARRTRGCAGRAGGGRSRRRPAAARSRGRARASSGPASRNEARIRLASCSSTSWRDVVRVHAHLVARRSTRPRRRGCASSSSIVSTSRMRGTFVSVTGSSVSRHAARIGSAPFLFRRRGRGPRAGGRPRSRTIRPPV